MDPFAYDILYKVFIKSHIFDIGRVLLVCKQWHAFFENESFWKGYFYSSLASPRFKAAKIRDGTWRKKIIFLSSIFKEAKDKALFPNSLKRCVSENLSRVLDAILIDNASQYDYSLDEVASDLGIISTQHVYVTQNLIFLIKIVGFPLHVAIGRSSFECVLVCLRNGFSKTCQGLVPGKRMKQSALELVVGMESNEL
jgi:hypothetical protein